MGAINHDLTKIKALIFDVDGVLSVDTVQISASGEALRTINIKDGYALQLALKSDLCVAVITGGNSPIVRGVLQESGLKHIYMASSKKIKDLEHFMQNTGIKAEEILYMGDDIPDYEALNLVGVATCPKDAAAEIKAICKYISPKKGGKGCVRDVVEQVLKAQGYWMKGNAFGW